MTFLSSKRSARPANLWRSFDRLPSNSIGKRDKFPRCSRSHAFVASSECTDDVNTCDEKHKEKTPNSFFLFDFFIRILRGFVWEMGDGLSVRWGVIGESDSWEKKQGIFPPRRSRPTRVAGALASLYAAVVEDERRESFFFSSSSSSSSSSSFLDHMILICIRSCFFLAFHLCSCLSSLFILLSSSCCRFSKFFFLLLCIVRGLPTLSKSSELFLLSL
jgi:hypothetical protein